MWQSKTTSEPVESILQSVEEEYLPPGKKSKEAEQEALKEAFDCCRKHEIGIEEASLIYGIPKSTIRAKLNEINCSPIDENFRVFILSIYPDEAESDLVCLLEDFISFQVKMTSIEIRRLAYELVREKYKMTCLPNGRNCVLGQRWYKQFIGKYPHLNCRNREVIENKEKSMKFYNNFEKVLNNFNIGPSQIYAVDGVDLKFRASCADVNIFHKRRSIYANAKAVCCISPVGDFIPPVFLKLQNGNYINLKHEELSEYDLDSLDEKDLELERICDDLREMQNAKMRNIPTSEDSLYIENQIKMHLNKKLQPMSEENEEELREKLYDQFIQLKNKALTKFDKPSSEITPEIFHEWFLNFLSHVKPNPERHLLLLLSDQNYIKSYKTLELSKRNNVLFLVLPPHFVHKIYPMDGFAMSLNRNIAICARRWLGKNPDFKVQKVPLNVLFLEAFKETVNPLIAKNGFLFSGIWPINRNIFQTNELGGESVLMTNKQKLAVNENDAANIKRNNLSSLGIKSEADLMKFCRVCIKEKMYMKPLLDTIPSEGPNYHGKKIHEISKVTISHEDGLPPFICQYCLVQLKDAIKIKETAIETHEKQLKLREALDRLYFEDRESEIQDILQLFPRTTSLTGDSKRRSRLMTKNFDINSICRICMEEKPLMTSIFFKPPNGTDLYTDTCSRIKEISHYQPHIHDGLSSSICPFCRVSIYKASDFSRKMLNSDKLLREIMSSFRTTGN